MGRPRTPTNVLNARGAFRKDPQRKRSDPQIAGPIGRAPQHLSKSQQKIWREIVKSVPQGVLGISDRIALEEMCYLIHESRTARAGMTSSRQQLLRTYLGQFGMTPADRAKISVPPAKPTNPFEDF